jgi:NNP family nitrate/nitrite transporter-like MFS transporter
MVSIGTVWGLDPLAGVFVGLPGGLLADRFGLKNTLAVVCLLSGIFSALRGFSHSFLTLAVSVFLFGLVAAITPSVAPKTTALWFTRRYLGLTNALLQLSWYLGAIIATMLSATVLSPLLGGWRNVLFLLGAPAIILGLLWLITGREPDKSELPTASDNAVPFRLAFSKVIRMKEVWIIGLIQLFLFGASSGFLGYLPLYLRNIGWTAIAADGAITAYNAASMIGIIPMVLLADRLGGKKGLLILSVVVALINLAVLPFIKSNWLFVLLIVSGFLRSAAAPICNTLIFETKGVGSTYGGTAIGLASTMGMLGSFAAPPLGNSLTGISPGAPFIFWAILSALALPLFFFIKGRSPSEVDYSSHQSL